MLEKVLAEALDQHGTEIKPNGTDTVRAVRKDTVMFAFKTACPTTGAASRFRGSAIVSIRGGHYFFTRKGESKVDKKELTQVGRALSQLGTTHIPSYSPQGRGRMERVFGTLQKRLPQELRLARIRTIAGANR